MNDKYKQDLKKIEKKYTLQKKHSPEYIAMEVEEKKLLKGNRFDEAIALQKLRKKQEEEDNKRYLLLHKAEIEMLKRNLTSKYNKEVNNFKTNKKNEIELIKNEMKTNKKNEIELIKNEMNIALDNIDKQFNNRRHDLISIQNNKSLIKFNQPLAKSRQVYRKTSNAGESASIKRIFGPLTLSTSLTINQKKVPVIKRSSMKKRLQSAKIDK